MAICNRDLDSSEQKVAVQASASLLATGVVLPVAVIDSPATLVAAKVSAVGISGTPTALLRVRKFITGAGATIFTGGATTLTVQAHGTSGPQSVVLAAAGSTALLLKAGDILEVLSGGTNAACDGIIVDAVIQYTQDIRSHYGE